MPAKAHLTVPAAWRNRRLRVPDEIVLHHGDIAQDDQTWIDAVPVTSPRRAIAESIVAHVAPEFIEPALHEARRRSLISAEDRDRLRRTLRQHWRTGP